MLRVMEIFCELGRVGKTVKPGIAALIISLLFDY